MLQLLWVKGFLLGISIAAPVGPIGLLCIRRTLAQGQRVGLISGMGAASADAVYGTLAAFGLTAIFTSLGTMQIWLQCFGAGFLIVLGTRTIGLPVTNQTSSVVKVSGLMAAFGSTFFLTLSNPATILSFLAVFSGLGFAPGTTTPWQEGMFLVLGVFCGSGLWWLLLSSGVHWLNARYGENMGMDVRRWVNRLAGLGLIFFGLLSLWSILWYR